MNTTTSNHMRLAGLAAMGSGILFVGIQAIHPLDLLENVNTARWAIVHYIGVAMGILGVLGVAGIHARQAEKSGWMGTVGYLLLTFFYVITAAFQFVEAFVSPLLASEAPQFVEGVLAIAAGKSSTMDLGALPIVYMLNGFAGYMLGGLIFGIATFRAGILPRWAGGLLAAGVVLPLITTGLIPHPFDRILAVPVAVAFVWLGYALWSERRKEASQPFAGQSSPQLRQVGAK
jgi:hypothetical protein